MSPQETAPSWGDSTLDQPVFVKNQTGITLFYPDGLYFRGYVVPDARRQRALGDALERYRRLDTLFGYPLFVPIAVSIGAIDGPHVILALVVLALTLVVAAIGNLVRRRRCLGQLLAGLERVDAFDQAGRSRQSRFRKLFFVGIGTLVIIRIVQGIQYGF